MSKSGSRTAKISIFTLASACIFVLGVGLISYALFNIFQLKAAQAKPAADIFAQSAAPKLQPFRSKSARINPAANGQAMDAVEPDEVESDEPSTGAFISLYPIYPFEGDVIGSLSIKAIELQASVIQGTGSDALKEGVGHFTQSVLPGEADNCVLSGHRDTFFQRLGELEFGDVVIVQTSAGIFTYEVSGTRIVDKDDKTVIVPTDHAVLTLTTCYPFIRVGPSPDRYIVSADLIASE